MALRLWHKPRRIMTTPATSSDTATTTASTAPRKEHHHFRFHLPHLHLTSAFGDDWFALKAEAFARFFGTPVFLVVQTLVVLVWILLNITGLTNFDVYPFILLNLAFSLQSAYAAPLILLAQTRQADRDKAHADADAQHREDLAVAAAQRQQLAAQEMEKIAEVLKQNTELTALTKELSQRIEALTREMHEHLVASARKG
jgi:uncharacterized membrane protein